jgi:hypothetical protein
MRSVGLGGLLIGDGELTADGAGLEADRKLLANVAVGVGITWPGSK